MSFMLIPTSILLLSFALYALYLPYIGLYLSHRKLSHIAIMTENVWNKLFLMSLDSDNNITSPSYSMLH